MCSIIAGHQKDILIDLLKESEVRAGSSFSFTLYNKSTNKIDLMVQDYGSFNYNLFETANIKDDHYIICHVQAPTKAANKVKIHPSIIFDSFLYHNGQLKDSYIKQLQDDYHLQSVDWDTSLMHSLILDKGFKCLSDIEGSFGALMYMDDSFTIFTNDMINLYIDDNFTLSSIPFNNSKKVESNKVYEFNIANHKLIELSDFNSKESPYYIPDI